MSLIVTGLFKFYISSWVGCGNTWVLWEISPFHLSYCTVTCRVVYNIPFPFFLIIFKVCSDSPLSFLILVMHVFFPSFLVNLAQVCLFHWTFQRIELSLIFSVVFHLFHRVLLFIISFHITLLSLFCPSHSFFRLKQKL